MMLRAVVLSLSLAAMAAAQPNTDKMAATSVIVFGAYVDGQDLKQGSRASGFLVGPDVAVTSLSGCCSVKNGHQLQPVIVKGKEAQPGSVVWSSEEIDVAIVKLKNPIQSPGVAISPMNMVREGQPVYTVQFPEQGNPELTEGTVNGTANVKDSDVQLLKSNGSMRPGNDGGALYDACGNVLGSNFASKEGNIYSVIGDPIISALQASGVQTSVVNQPCGGASASSGGGGGNSGNGGNGGSQGGNGGKQERPQEEDGNRWRLPRGNEWIPVVLLIGVLALAFRPAARQQVARAFTSRRRGPLPEPAPYPYQARNPYPPAPGGFPPSAPPAAPYPQAYPQQASYPQAGYPQQQAGYPPPGYAPQQPYPPAPMMAAKPVLRGIAGQYAGSSIPLDASQGTLGRDPQSSNLVVQADSVSKRHCTIRWDAPRQVFVLEDHGSTNGTYLATGERLNPNQPRDLRPGDRFYIGDLRNQFEVGMDS